MVIHFPIALLIAGAFLRLLGALRKDLTLRAPSLWCLRLGALGAWTAAGLGLLAEKTAPHVPPAWETLADHKQMGLFTAGAFAVLWITEEFGPRRAFRWLPWWTVAAWIAVLALLMDTAIDGGALVYHFGMGVAAAPHL